MNMDKKELKKILTEQRKEYQNYLGALAEDFDSKLSIIAESLTDIQKQLIVLRDMVAKNTEDIEIIKMDLDLIKNQLKRKIDIEEFESLEKRVAFLEKRI